jgi:hypothetical protein
VTPEGIAGGLATDPEGRWVAAVTSDSTLMLFPLEAGSPRRVAKLAINEEVVQWSADARTLFVSRTGMPLNVYAVDVRSGRKRLWKTIEVPDPAGVRLGAIRIARDALSYAYGYTRALGELYLVEGLK